MRLWTEEEVTYLRDNWGVTSIKTISRVLNRSERAISMKKYELNLGAFLENGDYITFKDSRIQCRHEY